MPSAPVPLRRLARSGLRRAAVGIACAVLSLLVMHRGTAEANAECGRRAVVLEYHDVTTHPTRNPYRIPAATFASQMDAVTAAGARAITVSELLAGLAAGCLPPRAVAVTFDDGYQGVYANALPILQDRGMVASLFLIGSDASVLAPREAAAGGRLRHLS